MKQGLDDISVIIARQKALSDALFQSIGEGAIATDERGNINRINSVALELLGFQRRELMGKWMPGTVIVTDENGEAIPTLDRPITQSVITGKPVTRRCFYRKKNGTLLPVTITVSPVMMDDRPVGAVEVFRDITEELAVDRVKSEFISLASHQLRTPATAVKTYLGMLKDGFAGALNAKQQEFVEIAQASNERQLQIVNDLLVVASTESGSLKLKKEKTDLSLLISEVLKQQTETIKSRGQTLQVDLPRKAIVHEVDPSFFKMVIDNLLSNASKYTPEGGRLSLKLARQAGQVELEVSDNGVGIDRGDFGKLFQKFQRIDNPLTSKTSGSGIGLYLLKQIVDLHEGRVDVESAKDKGTKFTVKLPDSARSRLHSARRT